MLDRRDFATCSTLEMMLAHLLGKRIVTQDDGTLMIAYLWRGKTYVSGIEETKND